MKFAKIILLYVLCLNISGCVEKGLPEIIFETEETDAEVIASVIYKKHRFSNYEAYCELRTIEEVRRYKIQLEFLLKNLSAIEAKMIEKEQVLSMQIK